MKANYPGCGYHLEVRFSRTRHAPGGQGQMKERRFYLETVTAVDYFGLF